MQKRLVRGRRLSRNGLLLALLSLQSVVLAQEPASTPDYSNEAVVIEQSRVRYRFEQDGTGLREQYMRIRVQSEAGVQVFGQLLFGYNAANERTEVTFVRVRKPDGAIVTTPIEGVQDLSSPVQRVAPIYTDFRQKHVTVQSLRPGDTLEFSVTTTIHTALAPGQFWTEYDSNPTTIVLDEQLDIDLPATRKVTLKTHPGFDPSIEEADGRRIYHWARANLTRQDKSDTNDKPKVETPKTAAIRLTTFESWEQVGRWYASLEGPQRVPGEEIRKKAAELIAGRTTDLAKAEALYQFVATNFRYVSLSLGAGRYQPRAAAAVLREQYGDCKDKHTLLASLLEAAGLKASAVLINANATLDPSFPSPSQFDHVITRAIVDGQPIWMDTTTEVAPFRLLLAPLRKKQALVVDNGGKPWLEVTPADPPMQSLVRQNIEATLGQDGRLDAQVTMVLRGDSELVMRMVFRSTPAAQWKDVLQGIVKAFDITGEVSDVKIGDPAAIKDPFTIEFKLAASRFASWTSKRVSVKLPLSDTEMVASANGDESDAVRLGAAPTEVAYKLRLQLPTGVTVRPPLPVAISRDYAEYRATYSIAGSVLSADRVVSIRQSELPAERRQDYAAFARVVAADARQSLALETSTPIASSSVSDDLEVGDLTQQAYEAHKAGNYAQAIALLQRALKVDPKHKVAWNNLGLAHMGLREIEPAVDAFRRQIEINPYDASAYTNLGRAYVIQRKFAEAEAAFLKQLEVNPLDAFAPLNLGSMYLEQRRYDRAVPCFEKAIALTPDNAWLHVQLGKAFLNSSREPEALKAFDRAIELSPSPTMWNDIGYELARSGVHLDRALQYAESAVSSATAASRNMDVARADATALSLVRSLGAYWDTLGWVFFARGDLNRALPYVQAAWLLTQHGEVGDHLGQIYEKLGRREDAVRAYAMTLSTQRPPVETRPRLENLLGGEDVDRVIASHRESLAKERSISIPGKGQKARTADFVVLLSSPSTVESVRLVGGDESLGSFGDAIRKSSFGSLFPTDVPAKLLRRGILACVPAGGCTFTLLLADDAQPVQ